MNNVLPNINDNIKLIFKEQSEDINLVDVSDLYRSIPFMEISLRVLYRNSGEVFSEKNIHLINLI